MTQFYSRNDVNYSGDVYSIPFDYIDKKEVKVYIDDELWTKWHFISEHQLTLDEVPEDIRYSNIISVRRETDIEDKVVTYDNNSLLTKENLNKSQDQLLYAVQEIYDNNIQNNIDIKAEVDEKVERVSGAVEQLEKLNEAIDKASNAADEAIQQAIEAGKQAEEAERQADAAELSRQESEKIHELVRIDSGIFYDELADEDIDVEIISGGYVTKSDLELGLDRKQDKGDYALRSELPNITPLATKTELQTGLNTKQDKGDYATRDELQSGLDTKQAKGNYAFKSDLNNLATKSELPTQVSELENDSNFATQTQVLQAIASIPQFSLSIVNELPTTGAKMTLYLVPKEGTDRDVYDEYIWIEQTASFEHLGTTAVDLTDYVKNTDYATTAKAGVIKSSSNYGFFVNETNGIPYAGSKGLNGYQSADKNSFIGKATLENIKNDLVKRAVTANDIELTDDEKASARTWLGAVGDTDYATDSKGGVVKTFVPNGFMISNGLPICGTKDLNYYNSTATNNLFVSKGTLNNVLTQYSKTVLTTEADYNALTTKDANTLYLIEE